ncbi:MAG: hypothetical protein A2W05_04725 [Candidatus Schekmanbacteria bacterium RBG_16_38_10]|uniref:Uncharacterized protein n=1 Tax=Candidatus Schekmanbacteria bacterium RBG_16_38_10 TaxID=1817879 RepID=A0A1F7RXI2_9BACT|nr:MAG: hypothetical protein A2W05_04725 [Candidatus Schekmanbacteria bacterium RBG_16_38_10]
MKQKWTTFTIGIMFGVIVALVIFIATNQQDRFVFAQGTDTPKAPSIGKSQDGDLILGIGGTASGIFDLCWIVKKGDNDDINLALYKVESGRTLKLLAARQINYDLSLWETNNTPPTVEAVKKEADAVKKVKDKIREKEEEERRKKAEKEEKNKEE